MSSATARATTLSASPKASPSGADSTSNGCAARSPVARYLPSVTRYIMPPAAGTAKNWAAYRARFVEPIRIRAGTAFWRGNERSLARAEEVYGVPAEIVVGIIGVETIFGRQMGDFRVIDALATLAFDFPSGRKDRSAFFRDELENWFVLCKSEGIDPLAWRQLRRRARHDPVHAVELQPLRGRLRRRRPRRPAREAAPTRSAASPTTSPSSAGGATWRRASRSGRRSMPASARRCSVPTSC